MQAQLELKFTQVEPEHSRNPKTLSGRDSLAAIPAHFVSTWKPLDSPYQALCRYQRKTYKYEKKHG